MNNYIENIEERKVEEDGDLEDLSILKKLGYKYTKIGWIPKEWKIELLGNMTSMVTNGFVGKATEHYSKDDDSVMYIQGFNVKENSFNFTGIKRVSRDFHKKNRKSELKENDLLTIQTGDVGLTTIVPKILEGSNCHALVISRFLNGFHSRFYANYFNSFIGRGRLKSIETGSTMKHLNVKDLKDFVLPVPPLPEQQKIAQILSTWDKAIDITEQLIAKKQVRKKGLMQQLLTGKKRFKEFVKSDKLKETKLGLIPEDWKVKMVSQVFEFLSTNSFSRNQMHYNAMENSVYNIHYGDIHATFKKAILDFEKEEFIPVIADNGKITSSFLQDGDIIIADASEDYEGVGKAIELKNLKNKNVVSGLHTFALRDILSLTAEGFRAYIFKNSKVSNAIKVIATGSKVYGISKSNLTKLNIILPPIEEQKKIASFLSTADEEIEKLQSQLIKLKEQKKGLMQKLLTGEVRVKIF